MGFSHQIRIKSAVFLLICCCLSMAVAGTNNQESRRLGRDSCSKIQHEIQKAIVHHKWGLDNLKFQQRLKRHPKYIVTIQHVRSLHEPLVELRCPGGDIGLDLIDAGGSSSSSPSSLSTSSSSSQKLELHFHETRFIADSVRLFDIHSIFPIHTGAMSVKLKLDPLIVTMDKIREDSPSINDIYYAPSNGGSDFAKEHRDDSDSVLDLEKEIESVFINRIQPDIQKQLSSIISNTIKKYFLQNFVKF